MPEGAPVEIEARILNKDIGFVHEGQPAVPYTRYGTLDGEITEVSDDAIEGEKLGLPSPRIAVPQPMLRVAECCRVACLFSDPR